MVLELKTKRRYLAYLCLLFNAYVETCARFGVSIAMIGGMVKVDCNDPTDTGKFCWSEKTQAMVLGAYFYGHTVQCLTTYIANRYTGFTKTYRVWLVVSAVIQFCYPKLAEVSTSLIIVTQTIRGILAGIMVAYHFDYIAKFSVGKENKALISIFAPDECVDKADENGSDYRGTVSVTASGHVCQRWDSQSPNKHSRTPEAEAYSDSGLQKNYCRNPDGESGAWCYNAEGTVPRWELCDIPTCIVNSASPFRTVDSNGGQVAAGTEGILLYNDMLVCDDGFSNNSATVICRNMGFGGSKSWRSEDDIGIPSNYDIGLDEVRCKNNYDLGSCTSETSHDCVRMESVRLVCE
ncbi:uncharacterized protein LOC134816163 isoform X2 [Bolinopsis microptera]|uniref:uncharacterized protein LOC134816163 isoform X2 n=1 Tax=Bolinopsis microptera TaxID=2820187 RepID=UPI003078FD9B